jgi:hypothetical protein
VLNKREKDRQQLKQQHQHDGSDSDNDVIPIVLDVDMSWRPFGIHIGAHRSLVIHVISCLTLKNKTNDYVDIMGDDRYR